MPYAERVFRCPDCGDTVVRRANKTAVVRCVRDAIAYSAEMQRQLHAKSGPLYDHWRRRQYEGLLRQLASTAPVETATGRR